MGNLFYPKTSIAFRVKALLLNGEMLVLHRNGRSPKSHHHVKISVSLGTSRQALIELFQDHRPCFFMFVPRLFIRKAGVDEP